MSFASFQLFAQELCTALARVGVAGVCALTLLILAIPKSLVAQTGSLSPLGIHKIRHVIIIMQENRSFDSYFGTFPGADGLPMTDGAFTVP